MGTPQALWAEYIRCACALSVKTYSASLDSTDEKAPAMLRDAAHNAGMYALGRWGSFQQARPPWQSSHSVMQIVKFVIDHSGVLPLPVSQLCQVSDLEPWVTQSLDGSGLWTLRTVFQVPIKILSSLSDDDVHTMRRVIQGLVLPELNTIVSVAFERLDESTAQAALDSASNLELAFMCHPEMLTNEYREEDKSPPLIENSHQELSVNYENDAASDELLQRKKAKYALLTEYLRCEIAKFMIPHLPEDAAFFANTVFDRLLNLSMEASMAPLKQWNELWPTVEMTTSQAKEFRRQLCCCVIEKAWGKPIMPHLRPKEVHKMAMQNALFPEWRESLGHSLDGSSWAFSPEFHVPQDFLNKFNGQDLMQAQNILESLVKNEPSMNVSNPDFGNNLPVWLNAGEPGVPKPSITPGGQSNPSDEGVVNPAVSNDFAGGKVRDVIVATTKRVLQGEYIRVACAQAIINTLVESVVSTSDDPVKVLMRQSLEAGTRAANRWDSLLPGQITSDVEKLEERNVVSLLAQFVVESVNQAAFRPKGFKAPLLAHTRCGWEPWMGLDSLLLRPWSFKATFEVPSQFRQNAFKHQAVVELTPVLDSLIGDWFDSYTKAAAVAASDRGTLPIRPPDQQGAGRVRGDFGGGLEDEFHGAHSDNEEEQSLQTGSLMLNRVFVEDEPKNCPPSSGFQLNTWKAESSLAGVSRVGLPAGTSGLHERVVQVYRESVPSIREHQARTQVVARVDEMVRRLWGRHSNVSLHVFGSSASGLLLSGGDIDFVIMGVGPNTQLGGGGFTPTEKKTIAKLLHQLSQAMKRADLVHPSEVEVIAFARVPIIKFVDLVSRIHCDVSIGSINGLKAVTWIRGNVQEFPSLTPICIILKKFLIQLNMNEPVNGGVGGFLLVNLIVSFLQSNSLARSTSDLGALLQEFFKHYALDFDYENTAVAAGRPQGTMRRQDLDHSNLNGFIAAEDPQQRGRDIGVAARKFQDIRDAFLVAYHALCEWSLKDKNVLLARMPPLLTLITTNSMKIACAKPQKVGRREQKQLHEKRRLDSRHVLEKHNKRRRILPTEKLVQPSNLKKGKKNGIHGKASAQGFAKGKQGKKWIKSENNAQGRHQGGKGWWSG